MTKSIYCVLALLVLFNFSNGQGTKSNSSNENTISTQYNRNSITPVVIISNNKYSQELKQATNNIVVPDKYDDNLLSIRHLSVKQNAQLIHRVLVNKGIPSDIIAKWFSRNAETGQFNMSLIHERGMYNATDADVATVLDSKIGLAQIKDAGELLVSNSFILALNIHDIKSMEEVYDKQDKLNKALSEQLDIDYKPLKRIKNGWKGDVKAYLYQLDFNDSVMNVLYNDLWIYDADDNDVIKRKKDRFNKMRFPLKFVIEVEGEADGTQFNKGEFLAPPKQLTKNELFAKLINEGMESVFYNIERKVKGFQVKAPLYSTKPLKSKIGKKEGLKTDQRFFVYEFIQTRKGKIKAKRKGVVRTKSIADNREIATGKSTLYSQFYQTSGFRLMEGMLLQQKNDIGIGVTIGNSFLGEMSGPFIKLEGNVSVLSSRTLGFDVGATQLKLYGTAAIQSKEYTFTSLNSGTGSYNMEFTRLNIGLSKGWFFANNFSINPFVGYATESATNEEWRKEEFDEDDNQSIGTDMVHWGAYGTINIRHNFQIVGTVNMYSIIGKIYDKERVEIDDRKYNEVFENRSGLSIDLGLRLEF